LRLRALLLTLRLSLAAHDLAYMRHQRVHQGDAVLAFPRRGAEMVCDGRYGLGQWRYSAKESRHRVLVEPADDPGVVVRFDKARCNDRNLCLRVRLRAKMRAVAIGIDEAGGVVHSWRVEVPLAHCLRARALRREQQMLHRAGGALADADRQCVPDGDLHQ
jgi:hypothetical protein